MARRGNFSRRDPLYPGTSNWAEEKMKQFRSVIAGGLLTITVTALLFGTMEIGRSADKARQVSEQICSEYFVPQDPGYGLTRQIRRLQCQPVQFAASR